jgi:hypothetical protein
MSTKQSTNNRGRLTESDQAALNASAAEALGLREVHVETINARQITFAEIQAIAASDIKPLPAYIQDQAGFLSPVQVKPHRGQRARSKASDNPHRPVYGAVPDTGLNARSEYRASKSIVGYLVRLEAHSVFGTTSDLRLFTTAEAEESSRLLSGDRRASDDRQRLYIADPRADAQPLMPIFGSEVTVNATLAGLDPDEVKARVEKALAAEFGDLLSKHSRVRTRPVRNRRIDAFDSVSGKPLAIGILDSETHLVMGRGVTVETRSHKPDEPAVLMGDQ